MLEAMVLDVSPRPPHGVRAPLDTQVADLKVAVGSRELDVALVLPGVAPSASEGENVAAELRRRYPNTLVVVEQSNAPGIASVTTASPLGELDTFMVAAGVAVIQYSWAWDESQSVVVTVNGIATAVQVEHTDGKSFVAKQRDAV